MPPKRKAADSLLGESPSKRTARSTRSSIENPFNPGISSTSATTTPRRVTKTYGRRSTARRVTQSLNSLKENEDHEEDGSDDEIDLLSPTEHMNKPITKPLTDAPDTPTNSPTKRTKSAKNLEIANMISPQQSRLPQVRPSLRSPAKGKAKGTVAEVQSDTEESYTGVARVTRSSAAAASDTATPSKPTPSPNKKHLTATENANIDSRSLPFQELTRRARKTPSPRKRPQSVVHDTERLQQQKVIQPIANVPTASGTSSVAVKQFPRPDKAQISTPTPLKLDSVLMSIRQKSVKVAASSNLLPRSKDSSTSPPTSPSPSGLLSTAFPKSPAVQQNPVTPHTSPSKTKPTLFSSPSRPPRTLPQRLYGCLNAQKRAIICALQNLPNIEQLEAEEEQTTNSTASQQLINLLKGTITRGEGNSCLVLGPKGSGKSRLVEQCILNFSGVNPIVIRLSGWTQYTDRLAMREIAYQLGQQTGTPFVLPSDDTTADEVAGHDTEEANPFLDAPTSSKVSLPPSSHLPTLISVLPTLNRPTIVVLDGFDLFALHPRQSLLYCLLDTTQSCRAAAGTKGLAVIGITSRIDTITALEKRVKSRFSGRMLRTAHPRTLQVWQDITRTVLSSDIVDYTGHLSEEDVIEWQSLWDAVVDQFWGDHTVQTILNETFSVTRDIRMLTRMLLTAVVHLSPTCPSFSASQFASAAIAQRARPRFPLLHTLPYPAVCLLIASIHADTSGQSNFTFEMLHEYFRDQVRASTSAPVQVNGGSIGMVRCSRAILMASFETLVSAKVFVAIAAYTPSVAKEFVKYRSVVDREEVKKAVDKMSQVNLKKWLTKAQ
ncbi:hypothetical protein H0H81_004953 [Sphagnurus paluster]|uniref:Origin recognition complex subunit 4 n=1 Tax=Sphagnurus paluster TaxID=117069 RepID=A0A9P7GKT5_9AGAR|nr:hypothetical protein H0H81_004953 [Sphagnurus paluster]